MTSRFLGAIATATLLVSTIAPITAAATLDSGALWVSKSAIDGVDYPGTIAGGFACADEANGTLTLNVSGSASAGLNGTFDGTISAEMSDGAVTAFDATFAINLAGGAGGELVTGTAHYHDTGAFIFCNSFVAENGATLYQFGAGLSPIVGGDFLFLDYSATTTGSDGTETVSEGLMAASIFLMCPDPADVGTDQCYEATSTLDFGAQLPPPPPQSLFVSNSSAGENDITGTITGSFACGTPSHLDAEIVGNAYGPYPGTFTQTVDADIADGLVTGFDVTFEVISGDTTINGVAHYPGGVSDGSCSSFFDADDNATIYTFSAGFGGGGHATLPLRYSATYVTDGVSHIEEGWLSAGINLYCSGSATFTDNCEVATGGLVFLEPVASGDAGEASTDPATAEAPIAVSIDNPSGGAVDITRLSGAQPPVSSYAFLGDSYAIHVDLPATVEDPILLNFVIHSSALFNPETGEPLDPETITVVRDGVIAADCDGTAMIAQPDPCVRSRSVDGAGDLSLLVLTSHASVWTAAYRTTISPRLATESTATALLQIAQDADAKTGKTLRKAIDALNASLEPGLWLGDERLTAKSGSKVFDLYHNAIKELTKKELSGSAEIGPLTEAIVDAARMLAQTAVDDAVAAGGNAKDVGAAQAALTKGDAAMAGGKFEQALDSYKTAWEKAQKALR